MTPAQARERGLTSTVTFPARQPRAAKARSSRARRSTRASSTPTASIASSARPACFHGEATRSRRSRARRSAYQARRCARADLPGTAGGRHGRDLSNHVRAQASFRQDVAVVTDGAFSGVCTGACIGHVGPEALAGGPIGKVRDGDLIEIVIDSAIRGKREFCRRRARRLDPAQAPPGWPHAPGETTSRLTRRCRTTCACGRHCKAPAAARGVDAFMTSSGSWWF